MREYEGDGGKVGGDCELRREILGRGYEGVCMYVLKNVQINVDRINCMLNWPALHRVGI